MYIVFVRVNVLEYQTGQWRCIVGLCYWTSEINHCNFGGQFTEVINAATQMDLRQCSTLIMNKSLAVAEIGDHARAKWAGKWEGAVPLIVVGELGPHQTQWRLYTEAYLRTRWHLDPSSRWLGHLTRKNRPRNDLMCLVGR